MKIILGHDSFTQLGGAERVFSAIRKIYPNSPVRTLVIDKRLQAYVEGWNIKSSWLQGLYNLHPRLQYFLPFIPMALCTLRTGGCNLLVTSSSGFIKAIRAPKGAVHVNYCHTPTRFLWIDPEKYLKQEVPIFLRPFMHAYLQWLKRWDLRAARRVDYFVANSVEVQKRIKKFYNRESVVITPFVDVNFWKNTRPKGDYFLIAGRLQAHKGNELIIEIFNELGLPLHVVGTGRQEKFLRSIAKPNITFLGRLSDEALRNEYSGALGYLYPQFEDFGLMPLEAAACGTATLGLAKGGSLETIIPGQTGELFSTQERESIKAQILNWKPEKYTSAALRSHAENFSEEVFRQRLTDFISRIKYKQSINS
jgi:glycosyltransferase involved in cell wall biosynthesis